MTPNRCLGVGDVRICPQCNKQTEEKLCPDDGFHTVVAEDVTVANDGADPMLGSVFEGRYRIESILGRGGFGAVYKAEQAPVGRIVAVKVIRANARDDSELRARFLREARSVARVCVAPPSRH